MTQRNMTVALATAGVYIGGALALKAAEKAGFASHDTAVRALQVFSGLIYAGPNLARDINRAVAAPAAAS